MCVQIVYVLSDVHGHYATFMQMLDKIRFSSSDKLYIVGDVIDRGKRGIAILQYIMEQKNIVLIRGNHEQAMLDARTNYATQEHWRRELGGNFTLQSFLYETPRAQQIKIYKYLEASPLEMHIKVKGAGGFHLVHGRPAQKNDDKLWGRFEAKEAYTSETDERVICGHTPTIRYKSEVLMSIYHGNGFIDIDCVCAFQRAPGRLACLRLNDFQEYYCNIIKD